MIGRPPGRFRHNARKTQGAQVEFVNENIDDADRIVLCHIVFQTLGEQCRLPPILTFNETLHPDLHRSESLYQINAFSHRLDP